MRARDSQRQKVYDSEMVLHLGSPQMHDWSEVEEYVAKVTSSAYVIRKYGQQQVAVGYGRGGGLAYSHGIYQYRPLITLGRWARRKSVILHELAHIYTSTAEQAHGWKFCAVYLDLVRHFLGQEAHDTLKNNYKRNRVRFTEPRKRAPMDAERKAVLVERLAVARAAKAAKSA